MTILCSAHHILAALSKRHTRDLFLAEVTVGTGDYVRLDALAVQRSWTRPEFVGYEVKVSRNDFLSDTKWPRYRDYCHRLYFVCPAGIIRKDEVADDVGLVTYNPETRTLGTVKKALYRDIGFPPADLLYRILINRVPSDHHPFFSSAREQLEAWVADKEDRRYLGAVVRTRLVEERDAAVKRLNEAEPQLAAKTKALKELREELREAGVNLRYDSGLPYDLKERLAKGVSPAVLDRARETARAAQSLVEMLAPNVSKEASTDGQD